MMDAVTGTSPTARALQSASIADDYHAASQVFADYIGRKAANTVKAQGLGIQSAPCDALELRL